MRIKNIKLFAAAMSGVLSLTTFTGCGEKYHEEKGIEFTRQFDVGEHIISVPLTEDISKNQVQIETVPGYEVMGIATSAYGSYSASYAGGVIVYSNVEEVECKSNVYDADGNYVYLDFGTPLNYEEDNNLSSDSTRDFEAGQHVILVPITEDITSSYNQYEYHDGYEVMGVTVSAYGQYSPGYAGGAIIYKNTVPVRAKHQEEGYVTFGVPIEKEQARTLK